MAAWAIMYVVNPPAAKADSARKYRAYPTSEQGLRLTGWAHSCRALWNMALRQRWWAYEMRGTSLRAVDQCRELTEARAEFRWLGELPAQAAQQVLHHLDRAY